MILFSFILKTFQRSQYFWLWPGEDKQNSNKIWTKLKLISLPVAKAAIFWKVTDLFTNNNGLCVENQYFYFRNKFYFVNNSSHYFFYSLLFFDFLLLLLPLFAFFYDDFEPFASEFIGADSSPCSGLLV